MNQPPRRWITVAGYLASGILGVTAAFLDMQSIGPDSHKPALAFLGACAGILGFLIPPGCWRWAVILGFWLPVVRLGRRIWDDPAASFVEGYLPILMLFLAAPFVTLIGVFGGAYLRGNLIRRRQ
jgi:hypothetical protein